MLRNAKNAGFAAVTPEHVMTGQSETQSFDLTSLLAPTRLDEFFREHWERKPLHLSRGDARYYDAILTSEDL